MIGIIGWIGNFFFILGAILLAKKIRLGWHCQVLGNLSYVIFAILMGIDGISLGALSLLLILINWYGLKKWENKSWILLKK